MTKSSSPPTTRHPRQAGSGRLRLALACVSHLKAIDGDGVSSSANGLPCQRQDPLEHWNARGQITIEIKERRERIRRLQGDKFGDAQLPRRLDAVETGWNAVGRIEDVAGWCDGRMTCS